MSAKGFRRHFTLEKLSLNHHEPLRFARGPWRRKPCVSTTFLVYRIIIALFMLGVILWSFIISWGSGKWFIYLTNWGFLLIGVQAFLAAYIVVAAYRKQSRVMDEWHQTENYDMPILYKIYWVLYNISIPVAFLITIIYWALLYNPEKKSGSMELNYTHHAGNSVIALIEIIVGGPPSRLLHLLHPFIFCLVYIAFNIAYWFAGGTDFLGNPWIYEILKWDEVSRATTVAVGCTILTVMLHLLVTLLSGLRSFMAYRYRESLPSNWQTQQSFNNGTFNKAFVSDVP